MKIFLTGKYLSITISILLLFVGTSNNLKAQSAVNVAITLCNSNNNFSSAVTIGAVAAPGVWYTDRYAPGGFVSNVNFGGDKRLKESISAADGFTSRLPAYQFSFYNTQGRSYDFAAGTQYMEINLYVPADWATSGRRMAGFWGVAKDVNGDVSGYPIIEFTSEGSQPRFRGWNDVNGWVDMGLPAGFAYNSWVKLQIELLASGEFKYTVGNLQMTTTANAAYGSLSIGSVILQGHNTTDGVSYDIYWDDLLNTCYIPCGNKNDKVIVCHNGNELCISADAVAAHLAHGDNLGRCEAVVSSSMTSTNNNRGPVNPDPRDLNNVRPDKLKQIPGESFKMIVAPNPSRTNFKLQVQSNTNEPIKINMLDASGRVLSSTDKLSKEGVITVGNDLKSGTYYAEVIQGAKRQVVKLIKLN